MLHWWVGGGVCWLLSKYFHPAIHFWQQKKNGKEKNGKEKLAAEEQWRQQQQQLDC